MTSFSLTFLFVLQGKEITMSKEEILAMLTKRTEQCKKMEGNISGQYFSFALEETLTKDYLFYEMGCLK